MVTEHTQEGSDEVFLVIDMDTKAVLPRLIPSGIEPEVIFNSVIEAQEVMDEHIKKNKAERIAPDNYAFKLAIVKVIKTYDRLGLEREYGDNFVRGLI